MGFLSGGGLVREMWVDGLVLGTDVLWRMTLCICVGDMCVRARALYSDGRCKWM